MPIQVLKDVSNELDLLELNTKRHFLECADSEMDFSVDLKSEEEVEKLEDSVKDSGEFFKKDVYLKKEINQILGKSDEKVKSDAAP